MKFDDLTTLRCFKLIYENKSITKTSLLMGLSKAAISKRLDAFEASLETKLFSRTTRVITPTQKSRDIINKVIAILNQVDSLTNELDHEKTQVTQKIKITCISTMAQGFLGKILYEYQRKNPLINIDLLVTDSVLDPIEHNIDISIRINPSKNSFLIGKKVGDYQLVAVKSSRCSLNSKIKTEADLLSHPLLFIDQHSHIFKSKNKNFLKKLKESQKFKTNDSSLINQLLVTSNCIAIRSYWDVKPHLKKKSLELVLPIDFFKKSGDVWVLSTKEKLENNSIRSIYDYIIKEIPSYLTRH